MSEPIIAVSYYTFPRTLIRNLWKHLPDDAKIIIPVLLDHMPNIEISRAGLAYECGWAKRDRVGRIINWLERIGFLKQQRSRKPDGTCDTTIITLMDFSSPEAMQGVIEAAKAAEKPSTPTKTSRNHAPREGHGHENSAKPCPSNGAPLDGAPLNRAPLEGAEKKQNNNETELQRNGTSTTPKRLSRPSAGRGEAEGITSPRQPSAESGIAPAWREVLLRIQRSLSGTRLDKPTLQQMWDDLRVRNHHVDLEPEKLEAYWNEQLLPIITHPDWMKKMDRPVGFGWCLWHAEDIVALRYGGKAAPVFSIGAVVECINSSRATLFGRHGSVTRRGDKGFWVRFGDTEVYCTEAELAPAQLEVCRQN